MENRLVMNTNKLDPNGTQIGNEYKTVGEIMEPKLEMEKKTIGVQTDSRLAINIKKLGSKRTPVGNNYETIGSRMDPSWQRI